MGESTLASVPLGLVIFAAVILLAAGAVTGWLAAQARVQRRLARGGPDDIRSLTELLKALPQPALVADSEGRVIAKNAEAGQLLQAFGRDAQLPLAADAAVGRAIRSRLSEVLEISLPGHPPRRIQISVSPFQTDAARPSALLVFTDPSAGSGRAEVYRRLTDMIAHELRTPLTAIMGHVEILGSCRIDEEALWRRSLGFVAGETERLARLVEDLLSLSRLDRISIHLQSINVRAVAEEALSSLFEIAEKNKVQLVLQAPADLPRAPADPDRLRQVFLNLVDNGIKYAPGSTVSVRLTPEAGALRAEVSDGGPGIAADDLPHIFEPLYRGKSTAAGSRGTGLGLTIVRTILDQHNAPISVHSEAGRGTVFTFSLPLAR